MERCGKMRNVECGIQMWKDEAVFDISSNQGARTLVNMVLRIQNYTLQAV